ncbi:chalcone isomerase family protein [Parachitinimonas caeni]|uniref:Chalcone isomerase family protein n=1 Tax=Parachitinimonas caeni TaxID=3031301 RepID=A0ABT7DYR0_9NEIS|nr:chalcone isomerase family protein [Parachitinimonas caeni]MDK2125205.1 chalcone isomerase family protein [Parachitinimonas caeni]
MRKLLVAACLATASLSAAALELQGVKLEDATKLANTELVLNGAGLRTKFGIAKVYVAALYLPQKNANADAIINANTPRRIVLSMLRDVESEKLHDSLMDGLKDNTSESELAALQPKIREMNAIFSSVKEVNKGDVVTLDFLPGKGTQISLKGQLKDVIGGDDFAKAMLKIWLGKNAVSNDLKAGLLGSK